MSDEAQFQEENHETPAAAQPPRTPKSPRPPKPPIESLPNDDPFAATNFGADGEDVPTGIDDVPFDLGVPGDDQFVFVSSDPRHALIANLLVTKKEDGYGKDYYLLTPAVAAFCKAQPSIKKFFKRMRIFLYVTSEGGYGLWLIRDSMDNWSVSDLGVVNTAKKIFTRRYTEGKLRKAHPSDAIPANSFPFPDKAMTGHDGILHQAFGDAFVITSTNHPVINWLLKGVK